MDAQQIELLKSPAAFAHAVDEVQLLETHISWVVLAGEFAYKIKKPVANSFLDYTSAADRKNYCEQELQLNRRYAAEVYLDVVPITLEGHGLRVQGSGPVIEYAVRMRRFPADALMSQRVQAGRVTTAEIRAFAQRLAEFHRSANIAPAESSFGSPEVILAEALDNCTHVGESHVGESLRDSQPKQPGLNQEQSTNESDSPPSNDRFDRESHVDESLRDSQPKQPGLNQENSANESDSSPSNDRFDRESHVGESLRDSQPKQTGLNQEQCTNEIDSSPVNDRFDRESRRDSPTAEECESRRDSPTWDSPTDQIQRWTVEFWSAHRALFQSRKLHGHVRECHGDLHLGNVVWWNGQFIPFDGIEFSDEFRWIDTLSDVAFLTMDLAACAQASLSRSLLNAYLEFSGDYEAVQVLTWYTVFRAMVRAKVSSLRADQLLKAGQDCHEAQQDFHKHLRLAYELTCASEKCELWITHGVSGSGKTFASEQIVQRCNAIRVRSDVERKRLSNPDEDLYSPVMTERTYARLADMAEALLQSGKSVIVDAAFLKRAQRETFQRMAQRLGKPFHILHCEAQESTLLSRLSERRRAGLDPSDADAKVLRRQLSTQEPLSADEMRYVQNFSNDVTS